MIGGSQTLSIRASRVVSCLYCVVYRAVDAGGAVPMCIFIQDVATFMRVLITLNTPFSKEQVCTEIFTDFTIYEFDLYEVILGHTA